MREGGQLARGDGLPPGARGSQKHPMRSGEVRAAGSRQGSKKRGGNGKCQGSGSEFSCVPGAKTGTGQASFPGPVVGQQLPKCPSVLLKQDAAATPHLPIGPL